VRAVAQIGTTIYVGGGFTAVGYGSGTIARSHLVALDATTGLHVPGFDPRADDDVNALLRSPDSTRLYAGGCSTTSAAAPAATGWPRSTPPPRPTARPPT
jgi:hypothetical protein